MKIVITHAAGRDLELLTEGRKIVEVLPPEPEGSTPFRVGDIVLARVGDIVPGLSACFVFLVPGSREMEKHGGPAYLSQDDIPAFCGRLVQGTLLPVQIVAEPAGVKPYRVTAKLSLSGKYCAAGWNLRGVQVSRKLPRGRAEELKALVKAELPASRDSAGEPPISGKESSCPGSGRYPVPAGEISGPPAGIMIRTAAGTPGMESRLLLELHQLTDRLREIWHIAQLRTAGSVLHREPSALSRKLRDLSPEEMILDPMSGVSAELLKEAGQDAEANQISCRTYENPGGADYLTVSGLNAGLDELRNRKVWLKSGAYLVIDRTEALCVIDVNSGKSGAHGGRGAGKAQEAAERLRTRVNFEAAEETFHQIRARNLSGMILIDFINVNEEHTRELGARLTALAAQDPLPMNFVDFTGLGLAELTRKKTGKALEEWLAPGRDPGKIPGQQNFLDENSDG